MKRFLVRGKIKAFVEAPDETRAEEFLASALEEMTDDPTGFVYDWDAIDTETILQLDDEEDEL